MDDVARRLSAVIHLKGHRMKLSIRTLSVLAALITLSAAGLSYWAGEQINLAGKESGDAREATFKSYRAAQSLKALTAGYELTMNEFYSTVLEFPAYQKNQPNKEPRLNASWPPLPPCKTAELPPQLSSRACTKRWIVFASA